MAINQNPPFSPQMLVEQLMQDAAMQQLMAQMQQSQGSDPYGNNNYDPLAALALMNQNKQAEAATKEMSPARGRIRQSDANQRYLSGQGNAVGGPGLDGLYANNPGMLPGQFDPTGSIANARQQEINRTKNLELELVNANLQRQINEANAPSQVNDPSVGGDIRTGFDDPRYVGSQPIQGPQLPVGGLPMQNVNVAPQQPSMANQLVDQFGLNGGENQVDYMAPNQQQQPGSLFGQFMFGDGSTGQPQQAQPQPQQQPFPQAPAPQPQQPQPQQPQQQGGALPGMAFLPQGQGLEGLTPEQLNDPGALAGIVPTFGNTLDWAGQTAWRTIPGISNAVFGTEFNVPPQDFLSPTRNPMGKNYQRIGKGK